MDFDHETLKLLQEEFQDDFVLPLPQGGNISDSILARQLQDQFQQELQNSSMRRNETSDLLLARSIQDQFVHEKSVDMSYGDLVYDKKNKIKESTKSLVDPSWEIVDPTPDIHVLFMAFNQKFFWGKLDSVCVSWSKRMKRCAGICSYQGRAGLCSITLSEPLLKLRPRKDLIETLLHEMIHALLFVTHNNKDRDGHGPEFHKHMYRINKEAGTNITVYHSFHDEVELYLVHWWRCDGPCQKWKPYFGIVRRSANRAPGPYDRWWGQHSRSCGGTFIKIKSPEPTVKASRKTKAITPVNDIRKLISNSVKTVDQMNKPSTSRTSKPETIIKTTSKDKHVNVQSISKPSSGLSTSVTIASKTNNIHGFTNQTNKTFVKGATKINSNAIVVTKKPTTSTQAKEVIKSNDKSKIIQNTGNSGIGENLIDYDVVRNHWINKFSNTQNNNKNNSNKRKSSEILPVTSKVKKIDEPSSQDSYFNSQAVPCPVCNISVPMDELNRHLDICLNKPKNNCKECIVCLKEINENEYQKHVSECVETNFGDCSSSQSTPKNSSVILIEDDDMEVDYVKCSVCENPIVIEELEEHSKICKNRTKCPECGKKIESSSYDVHLADCLMKKLDAMDQHIDDSELVGENNEKDDQCSGTDEKISCLVCGKDIIKSDLYSHLDECVKEVFNSEETEENTIDEDDKFHNCPFCLKLVTEIDMSDHIDQCLKTVDCDPDAEKNKSLFLSEID